MLRLLLDVLAQEPARLPVVLAVILSTVGVGLLVAITVHEFSHALIASRLGDETARRLGRVSLNPFRHLDPAGTLMLLVVGFGWGRPVPVNPFLLQRGPGPRRSMAMVAAAGPLSNLGAAFLLSLPLRAGLLAWHSPSRYPPFAQLQPEWIAADILGFLIFFNVLLGVFNLLPLAPLDGFAVALGLLPRGVAAGAARLQTYGPPVLLTLVMVDIFLGWGLLSSIITPLANVAGEVLVGRALF